MIASIGILVVEILGLYLLSRRLTNAMYRVCISIIPSRTVAVSLITALLFPGTVLHELSHLFTAELLGVPTGKLTLEPKSVHGDVVEAGSVSFRKTDPFRRSLIGLAPFFTGLSVLFVLATFIPILYDRTLLAFGNDMLFSSSPLYLFVATAYAIFCISLTMFASPQDMKGVVPLSLAVAVVIGLLWFAGLRIPIPDPWITAVHRVLSRINGSLSAVLVLDFFLYAISSVTIWLVGKR